MPCSGNLLPPRQEHPLTVSEEHELWASCVGAEFLADASEDEDQEAQDKCEVIACLYLKYCTLC